MAWSAFFAFFLMVFFTYRWAVRPLPRPKNNGFDSSQPVMRLENAAFESLIGERRSWSLSARSIDFQKLPGGALSSVRKATIEAIKEGKLYEVLEPEKTPKQQHEPTATFSAEHGDYQTEATSALPYDLALLFSIKWRFHLTGNVRLVTRSGAVITAPTLTILELKSNTNGKIEQRILCNDSAKITTKQVALNANKIRMNPSDKVIEGTEGVRAEYNKNTFQTDRIFWTVKEEQLFCPNTVSGVWSKMGFTADNITLDLKQKILRSPHIRFKIDLNALENLDTSLRPKP
jgi:hypothetical protein